MIQRPGDIDNWLQRAEAGDRVAYGRGSNPPRDLVQAMRPLVESEAVRPLRKREGREFLFLIERTARPLKRMGRTSRGPVNRPRRRSVHSRIFDVLVQAARVGRPCPTNPELARRCGLNSKQAASHQLHALAERGRIALEGGTNGTQRIVTILWGRHAGCRTAAAA